MNIWFTADTHFGHANIIKHCSRPFENIEAMDSWIIDWINREVKANDILYHLGDFAFARTSMIQHYLERINCKNINLVLGNHDKLIKSRPEKFRFANVYPIFIGNILSRPITLCHYAMHVWNKKHYGAWHLYGHSHNTLHFPDTRCMDVGVDTNRMFQPYHFDEITEMMGEIHNV